MTNNLESRRQKRFWNQLLKVIERGNVVPVVGEDLLVINTDPVSYFYDGLAQRFAQSSEYEICRDSPCTLSATVRNHPDFIRNRHDISQEIGEEFEDWDPAIPEPIRALARIRDFKLFVSTTFDNFLERALNEERFDGKPVTRVIAYSPKLVPTDAEIQDAIRSDAPVIFQIFGNYTNPLNFALTEGDKLEYLHHLHSNEHCPNYIFSELHERPLLLIGNKFPDWLARTFLRLTRRVRLDDTEVPKQYLSDTEATKPDLKFFLEHFTTNTDVIVDQSPAEFATNLEAKWQQSRSGNSQAPLDVVVNNYDALRNPPPPNCVFISYAATTSDSSEAIDKRVAIKIRNKLEEAGINAWLDLDELHGGDDYARKIRRFINTCGIFMPIISDNTNSRDEGFFRREWSWAVDRLSNFTGSARRFVVPIALGGIDPYSCEVPEEFLKFQFLRIDSSPDADFIQRVKAIYESEVLEFPASGIAKNG